MNKAIAVIGAGASGLLTAINILKETGRRGPKVFLIEHNRTFGSGAAYSTNNPDHLLNTRAGNMSAFPDDPQHFFRWLQEESNGANASPASFALRSTYGRYLRTILNQVATSAEAAGCFYLVADEAVSLKPDNKGRFILRLGVGKDICVDAAVLATGNAPPYPPGVQDNGVLTTTRYIGDPWSPDALNKLPGVGTILLLGSGLTMVDVAVSITGMGHKGKLVAMSRRGLLSRRHGAPAKLPLPSLPTLSGNIVRDLKALRQTIATEAGVGRDWRDVFDALRPMTAAYWRSLPRSEQRRFLRHLRPWWDVHRHRLAPEVAATVDALMGLGKLRIERGRLQRLDRFNENQLTPVRVTWIPRGESAAAVLSVSCIVNCMGPGDDPRLSASPLIRQMMEDGLIRADELGLGLALDDRCRILNRAGAIEPAVFALGPVTRGTFWEVTAIPDIRVQAAEVAKSVCGSLS